MQLQTGQMKEISQKQADAIKQILLCRDFNLAEYKKLRKILDSRVITRRDASAFLEYCFARVHFERYFNGHKHKAYAACDFCKGRDGLMRIENIKTGERRWCCQDCTEHVNEEGIMVVPRARNAIGKPKKVRAGLVTIGGLATEMALMADEPEGVNIRQLGEMAQEIMETAGNLLNGKPQMKLAEIMARATNGRQIIPPDALRCVQQLEEWEKTKQAILAEDEARAADAERIKQAAEKRAWLRELRQICKAPCVVHGAG